MHASTTGIYAIRHTVSGKRYVGSAVNFAQRWRVHRCLLRKGSHHSPYLQAAWNKHGGDSFVFEKLLVCSQENLLMYEQLLIDGMDTFNRANGYNARPLASSSLGVKASDETRAKIRAARAKQVFSEETKALWSKNRTGRKMPDWFGEFTRSHRKGARHTVEARAKISAAGIGRQFSIASREKRGGKMTYVSVQRIRELYATGTRSQSSLASEYGVDNSHISRIVRNKVWNCSNLKGVMS